MMLTRRQFQQTLAAIPFAPALASVQRAKPNSKWAGVQVGMNVPYNFGTGNYTPADEILGKCVALGISGVELRAQPVELFLGGPGRGTGAETLRSWRATAPVGRLAELRRTYEQAGVTIEIVKFDGILGFVDDELDYSFNLAKALGARAISCELPVNQVESAKRLGQFAEKHRTMIGFHGHTQMTPAIWEQAFTYSTFNGANLDIGHFVGGNKTSPIPFLDKHHDRITHLHVKDKTLQDKNVPFGEGDTPIREALQLIRDRHWNIQATIEFEYAVPEGSDRMKELAKCVDYCRRCLLD